jgi:hypothetical protein
MGKNGIDMDKAGHGLIWYGTGIAFALDWIGLDRQSYMYIRSNE